MRGRRKEHRSSCLDEDGEACVGMSVIAWLDTSPEEQRRRREVLRLFEQHESRDELGLGQVRDVLSDALFPGFSVLHTRARYYLFIPWCFQAVGDSSDRAARVGRTERVLADTLARTQAPRSGVIGARTGPAVKTLPSAIYWSGLRTFGVLTRDVAPSQVTGAVTSDAEADELVGRSLGDWHPTLPAAPRGFPREVDGGFDLTRDEATWLRERMVEGAGDTLLGHLVRAGRAPEQGSITPWSDPLAVSVAGGEAAAGLRHAEVFSRVMHGASMLYLMLVAEAYASAGFADDAFSIEPYRQRLKWWVDGVDRRNLLDGWSSSAFWTYVLARNPRIGPRTRAFVDDWLDVVRSGRLPDILDDHSDLARRSRTLVGRRERTLKAGQSRLVNRRLLQTWSPADIGRQGLRETPPSTPQVTFTYRWTNVRAVLRDIVDGLERGRELGPDDVRT